MKDKDENDSYIDLSLDPLLLKSNDKKETTTLKPQDKKEHTDLNILTEVQYKGKKLKVIKRNIALEEVDAIGNVIS